MKILLALSFLVITQLALAAGTCDLSANDQAVAEVNEVFDNGRMRGEDHVIALMELYEQRLSLIEGCATKDTFKGITSQELIDTLDKMEDDLKAFVTEINEAIRISVEHDRIGMATQLTMERDLHIAEKKLLMKKIKTEIK